MNRLQSGSPALVRRILSLRTEPSSSMERFTVRQFGSPSIQLRSASIVIVKAGIKPWTGQIIIPADATDKYERAVFAPMANLTSIALIGSVAVMFVAAVFIFMYMRSPERKNEHEGESPGLRTELKPGDFIEYGIEKQGAAYTERYEIISAENGRFSVRKKDIYSEETGSMSPADFLGKIRKNAQKMSGISYREDFVPTRWGNIRCTVFERDSGKKVQYIGKDGVLYREEETDKGSKYIRTLKDTSLLG